MIEIPRAEHVWVTEVQVWGDRGAPGLLLGWRQDEHGWEGYVVTASLGGARGSGPYVTQRWHPADRIRRCDEEPAARPGELSTPSD